MQVFRFKLTFVVSFIVMSTIVIFLLGYHYYQYKLADQFV